MIAYGGGTWYNCAMNDRGTVLGYVAGALALCLLSPSPCRGDSFPAAMRRAPKVARPSARLRGFNLIEMLNRDWAPDSRGFSEEDFRMISGWGFNFVRLPLDYRYWIKDGDRRNWEVFDEAGLAKVDAAVELGRKHKVHVQLCLHRIPGYSSGIPGEPTDIFKDHESLRVACAHWSMLARRYRGVPNERLSFNLFNEPPYIEEAKYAAVARRLIGAIRAVDKSRLIVVDGTGYGRIAPLGLGPDGVGFGWHCYDPFFVTHYKTPWNKPEDVDRPPRWPVDERGPREWLIQETCASKGWDVARAAGVFVHVGEFGVWRKTSHAVALALMEDQLKFWKELGVGWALWNLRGDFGVLDSNREDVQYEDFNGHKLDRKMLDLLRRY